MVWTIFFIVIILFLALDLGLFHKNPEVISTKEAARWSVIWCLVAFAFAIPLYYIYKNGWVENAHNYTPTNAVLNYITGYLIELSLSLDNIFVIAVIFRYFKIPMQFQHRVLFWGIMGALVLRLLMIFAGVALIDNFAWITYVFGVFLIYTAYKLMFGSDDSGDLRDNKMIKIVKRFYPVTDQIVGQKLFINKMGIKVATPLFLALIVIETSDIMFAVDSIPAILSITSDPFLVFTSNIFAILGLRSMYFIISSMMDRFKLLKYSLSIILAFVGFKLLLAHFVHLESWVSLVVIVVVLGGGILASMRQTAKHN